MAGPAWKWKWYWTVIIPYVPYGATMWHPNEAEGPFAVLSRGAFPKKAEALAWGKAKLAGHPFSVKRKMVPVEPFELRAAVAPAVLAVAA